MGVKRRFHGNGIEVPVERCIAAGVTAATAVVRIGNREQIYVHFSCINLGLSLLVTSIPEPVGSEMCLDSDLGTGHFIN